ncbi:MAG: hypothetical protein Q8N98_02000, partial [bacterium]|nr:hypothetical protein [bacterium]
PGSVVEVTNIASSLAVVYEKIRNSLSIADDRLLRRGAIERILNRRLTLGNGKKEEMAADVIRELIWARYLKNNAVSQTLISEVQTIINRYFGLFEKIRHDAGVNLKKSRNNVDFFLAIASAEIDKKIVPARKDDAWVGLMYQLMRQFCPLTFSSHEECDVQVYLACQKALFSADAATLCHLLMKLYYPGFFEKPSPDPYVLANYQKIKKELTSILHHSRSEKVFLFVKRKLAPFILLRQTLEANWEKRSEFLSDPEKLKILVRQKTEENYQKQGERLSRIVNRSIVYLLLTKMVFLLILEAPLDKALTGRVNTIPLLINLLFPPTLLLTFGKNVRLPDRANTDKIVAMAYAIVYEDSPAIFVSPEPPKATKIMKLVFRIIYLATFAVSFGGVLWVLKRLSFSLASGGIFFFFVSVVAFFAYLIRGKTKDLVVTTQHEGAADLLIDFFSLPFLKVGQILSSSIAQVNFIVFLFDFILEAPLKILLEILEQWIKFVREKKEEISVQ